MFGSPVEKTMKTPILQTMIMNHAKVLVSGVWGCQRTDMEPDDLSVGAILQCGSIFDPVCIQKQVKGVKKSANTRRRKLSNVHMQSSSESNEFTMVGEPENRKMRGLYP